MISKSGRNDSNELKLKWETSISRVDPIFYIILLKASGEYLL